MAKSATTKRWLNIVIIVISALILAFTLLGKFMDRATPSVDQSPTLAQPNAQGRSNLTHRSSANQQPLIRLSKLDFGYLQLTKSTENKASSWVQFPEKTLTKQQLVAVIQLWQQLLTTPVISIDPASENYLPVTTVLLSLSGSSAPLIVKVAQSKIQANRLLVTFVSTGQQIILADTSIQKLIPKSTRR